jgi:hypothetical protein
VRVALWPVGSVAAMTWSPGEELAWLPAGPFDGNGWPLHAIHLATKALLKGHPKT